MTSEYRRVPENNTSSIDAERSSVVICRGPDARTLVTRPRLAQPVPIGTSTSRNAPNATAPLPASWNACNGNAVLASRKAFGFNSVATNRFRHVTAFARLSYSIRPCVHMLIASNSRYDEHATLITVRT